MIRRSIDSAGALGNPAPRCPSPTRCDSPGTGRGRATWVTDRGLVLGVLLCSARAVVVVVLTIRCLRVCESAGGGWVVLLLARARRFTYSARSSRAREAFLGCTSHAADLQQRAEFGEDCRIFGGVVTDDWMMPFKPAVPWDCVTACLLH
jgi:hypothetical protein